MAKKPYEFQITRTQYKAIKKMDHVQMDQWLKLFLEKAQKNAYDVGFKAGVQASYSSAVNEVTCKIKEVKGVGPALFDRINSTLKGDVV